jgi:hypothetical protein
VKEKFNNFLKEMGRRELHTKRSDIRKGKEDFDHKSFWLGDLVVVYIEKINSSKK